MAIHFFHAPILSLAAVAHQGVANHCIQDDVDQGGREQNTEGPHQVGVVPGDRAADDADDDEPYAKSLGKVFADEQIDARADQAAPNAVALDGTFVDGDFALAVWAAEFASVGLKMSSDALMAGGASVGDVHCLWSVVGGELWAVGAATALMRHAFYPLL